jgi:hypothetical protein
MAGEERKENYTGLLLRVLLLWQRNFIRNNKMMRRIFKIAIMRFN